MGCEVSLLHTFLILCRLRKMPAAGFWSMYIKKQAKSFHLQIVARKLSDWLQSLQTPIFRPLGLCLLSSGGA